MQITRKADLQTARWAHGTTTQLYIFPSTATYKELNFDFRISTATIEAETTTFSSLPGVQRTLMVLDGTLELNHKDQHSTILHPYETDVFSGDWETTSGGKVTDFNLMIRKPGLTGNVKMMLTGKKTELLLETEKHGLIYVHKGEVIVGDDTALSAGDSIYFDSSSPLKLKGKTNATLIYVSVK